MKKLLTYSLKLLALSMALYGLQLYALPDIWPVSSAIRALIPHNYIFLFLLHLISYTIIWVLWRKTPDKAGFAFLGLSLIKIIIAVAYLYPSLQDFANQQVEIIAHFMAPYMIMLFFEVFEVYQLIKNLGQAKNNRP